MDSAFGQAAADATHDSFRFVVEDAERDDNSVVTLHPKRMVELKLVRNDVVLIKGKLNCDTVCALLPDENVQPDKVRMNQCVRKNLKCDLRDSVTIHAVLDIKFGECIHVSVVGDLDESLTGENLVQSFLKPYFSDQYRPVFMGDVFLVRGAGGAVEFKIVETVPAKYCIVGPDTFIYCKGDSVKRVDAEKNAQLRKELLNGRAPTSSVAPSSVSPQSVSRVSSLQTHAVPLDAQPPLIVAATDEATNITHSTTSALHLRDNSSRECCECCICDETCCDGACRITRCSKRCCESKPRCCRCTVRCCNRTCYTTPGCVACGKCCDRCCNSSGCQACLRCCDAFLDCCSVVSACLDVFD